jgi:hypothetical protein
MIISYLESFHCTCLLVLRDTADVLTDVDEPRVYDTEQESLYA